MLEILTEMRTKNGRDNRRRAIEEVQNQCTGHSVCVCVCVCVCGIECMTANVRYQTKVREIEGEGWRERERAG